MSEKVEQEQGDQPLEAQKKRRVCWNCSLDTSDVRFFCQSCEKIQEPRPDLNAFAIFSLPPVLDIDHAKLEGEYLKLSRLAHPDRFVKGSSREVFLASLQSSHINQAYKTLEKLVPRGRALLELLCPNYKEEEDYTCRDSVLLKEAFEDQEALAEVRDLKSLYEVKNGILRRQQQSYEELKEALNENEFGRFARELDRYRYYEKALGDATEQEQKLLMENNASSN